MENFQQFSLHTTIHGFSFIGRQNFRILKAFWTVFVLLGFSGLSFHLYNIINSYLQYKSTESSYEKRDGYKFPDITICNLKPISISNFKETAQNNSNVHTFYRKYFEPMDKQSNAGAAVEIPGNPRDLFWALGDEARNIGHKLSDIVVRCLFEKNTCNENDFVLFQFPALINC